MRQQRELQRFTIQGGDGDAFKAGDIITIEGVFVPTWWERMWRYRLMPIRVRIYAAKCYLRNVWFALCGRRDG
jgi:hypothetical protein